MEMDKTLVILIMVSTLILEQISSMVTLEIYLNEKTMKELFFICIIFMSCSSDKIFKKQIKNNEINVDWYHYSYISSGSPNYVVVKKEAKEELIFEHGFGLQDIELLDSTIIITHFKFQKEPKIKKENVFGYTIKYQEVSSHEMYLKHIEETKQK
jgi:hypothetical protein